MVDLMKKFSGNDEFRAHNLIMRDKEVRQLLKSPEVRAALTRAAEKIAKETQNNYRKAGKDFTFEVEDRPDSDTRAKVAVVSRDGDAVRYSEAFRGLLLEAAHKKRRV